MARRLGDCLLEDGILSADQLELGLEAQRQFGGSLGTHLLALGVLDEAALGAALSRVYAVPCVGRDQLLEAPPEVVALLSADYARRHRAIPFRVEGESLALAMQNPSDTLAVHEAAFLTGFVIAPYVASEVAVRAALARHHHLPDLSLAKLEARARALAAAAGVPLPPRPRTAPTTAAGAGPEAAVPAGGAGVAAASSAAASAMSAAALEERDEESVPTEAHGEPAPPAAAEETADTGPVAIEALEEAAAEATPTEVIPRPAASAVGRRPAEAGAEAAPPAPPAVAVAASPSREPRPAARGGAAAQVEDHVGTLAIAGRRLAAAIDKEDVVAIAADELTRLLPRAIVFIVRGDQAVPVQVRGLPDPPAGAALPLKGPSVLAPALEGRLAFGPFEASPADREFFARLGTTSPASALVAPVIVRGRSVLVLYADDPDGSSPMPDFAMARKLTSLAACAVEIAILRAKILKESGAL